MHWLASREMTMSDAVDEARRVLAKYPDLAAVDPVYEETLTALSNLLSHVERTVDAEVEQACKRADNADGSVPHGYLLVLVKDLASMLRSLAAERDDLLAVTKELTENLEDATETIKRLTVPVTGDRAKLVKRLRDVWQWAPRLGVNGPPVKHYDQLCQEAAALLEADARREAALAEVIREIEALFKRQWADESYRQGYNDCHEDVIAILAKVADGGER